jgi:hypothetical protein
MKKTAGWTVEARLAERVALTEQVVRLAPEESVVWTDQAMTWASLEQVAETEQEAMAALAAQEQAALAALEQAAMAAQERAALVASAVRQFKTPR